MHGFKVCHKDIKSHNIMLDKGLNPKIIDFGISKSFENLKQVTDQHTSTLSYAAPEIIRKEKISHKVDQFAFGILLYEIITNSTP